MDKMDTGKTGGAMDEMDTGRMAPEKKSLRPGWGWPESRWSACGPPLSDA
ncbi:MAG: hypothetical protein ACLQIB_08795 [Isosphaeraceae bacterium]